MLIGGAPLDGNRYIWWNFVASRNERISQAADDWQQQRFGKTADGDCRIEGLRCRKACDVLAYLVGPPPGDSPLDWAHYLTLWNVETSRILLAR